MFKTDNSLHVFAAQAYTKTSDASSAAAGELFVVSETGADFGGAVGTNKFKVGQKDDNGNIRFSPLINGSNMTVTAKAYSAASEQDTEIGFNGTSGSIDAQNSNRYTVRVNFKNNTDLYSEQSDLHFFEYVSDASATQLEIVDYFAQVMSKNEKFSGKTTGKKRGSVKVERFSNATSSAIANSETLTVTNGSKVVVSSDTSHALIAGDYVRIGHATTKTNPVYKVVSVSGANITLDQPFQGASASTVAAGEFAAGAEAAGIKITGLAQEWKLGLFKFDKITFDVTLDGFGTTAAPATTAAAVGSGEGEQVAELEWFGTGSTGAPYRHGVVNNTSEVTAYADSTATYGIIEIDFDIAAPKYAVAGAGAGRGQLIIALKMATTNHADLETAFATGTIF